MYYRPAEWRKEKVIWLAWPFNADLWQQDLLGAQQEFISLLHALKNEQLVVIVADQNELDMVVSKYQSQLKNISLKVISYADIWLRDTFPIFVKDEQENTAAVIPRFNGWGKKYLFKQDKDLSTRIADILSVPKIFSSVVFEGGAIECDGAGTMLTTEQCLLNDNRNPSLSKTAIESEFAKLFGVKKIIWLKDGLKNDHTDGHIDTIARFLGPKKIAIMTPQSHDDPNYKTLMAIKKQLEHTSDANGDRFELVEIPSPGAVMDRTGALMPASYLNFIIGDNTVVVPLYGTKYDDQALKLFKNATDLDVVGVRATSILSGGGAFHCISQEYYR